MVKINLNTLELLEVKSKENPLQRCSTTFPLLAAHGAEQSATVFVQLLPGDELGTHTDSAEELLLVLEGKIEAEVGNEKAIATEGELILVPRMIPHNFRNAGPGKAKVIGFFGGANNIVATFENTWLPMESKIVNTALING